MARKYNQFKPAGWRGESFRHYLAAKGISTKRQYFVRDELKGNRSSSALHRAFSKGFSKEDLRRDESARSAFGVSLEELSRRRRKSSLPEDISSSEEPVSQGPTLSEGEPLPDTATTNQSVGEGAGLTDLDATSESMVMSPGVPPAPSGPDSAFFKTKDGYFQRKVVQGSIVSIARQKGREATAQQASRDVKTPAKIAASAATNAPLSAEEENAVIQARADIPTRESERQSRVLAAEDALLEQKLRLPRGSLQDVDTQVEGRVLAKEIEKKQQFISEDAGKSALQDVRNRLIIEKSKSGTAKNNGRITFLQEARATLTKQFGSGPEKEELKIMRQIGQKASTARRSASAKNRETKKRQENVSSSDLDKDRRERLAKQLQRAREKVKREAQKAAGEVRQVGRGQ